MKTDQLKQVRRAALAAGVGGALVAGVLLLVPDRRAEPAPAPGPEARAMAAVGAGAPAALPDLNALIRGRENRVRTHPEDAGAWAVLGSAYVERGVRRADPASFPQADRALRRSLQVLPGGAGGAGAGSGSGAGAGSGGAGSGGSGARGKGASADTSGRTDALVGLGALANARHDYGAARKWGEEVRKREPGRWAAYPVLIDAYNGLGDYEAAGKALDRLKKLRPGAPVLERAAVVYRDRGWREDAAAKAVEATARAATPAEKAQAQWTQGELSWERGEPAEALGHYDAALKAVRDHAAALAGRARALAALGRTDEAYATYQRAITETPRPEYALELGELYDAQGLDGDAQSQYAALRARAEEAQVQGVNEELVLARFETDHGDPKSAVERLRAEWARKHRSMDVADALGWALFRTGEGKEALSYAKKATEQGRRSALFSYHRGEIERSLEMDGAARRHIEEALRTHPAFSPLLAPKAREALDALGEPAAGGPKDMYGKAGKGSSGSGSGSGSPGSGSTSGSASGLSAKVE
ncbi:tetratricopeptide repeat protein [Streptomyces liangshanensis]|uniref:tetratricopeptide repeat protein n=1 Tax=Streptomyces liangshanensis TaxID=2717324 RepID=UPI0036DB080E